VSWFREILNKEPASEGMLMTFGRRELRFFSYQMAIAFVPGVPVVAFLLLLQADPWWIAALSVFHHGGLQIVPMLRLFGGLILSGPATIAAIMILPRLMMSLPAVALDETGPLVAPLWQHSRGMTGALLRGWFICVLPALGLSAMLWFELTGALGDLTAPVVEMIAYICLFVALALSGGFLSHIYSQLTAIRPLSPVARSVGLRVAAE
jgi:hypothetical protein